MTATRAGELMLDEPSVAYFWGEGLSGLSSEKAL
jgi:hypothetical protein